MVFQGYHQWVIRSLLRVERAALESMGGETALITSDNVEELTTPLTMRNDEEQGYSDVDVENNGVRVSSSPSASRLLYCPKSMFLRKILLGATFITIIAVLATFFYIHFKRSNEDLAALLPNWILEWVINPLIWSFPFAAPIHRALGFFNAHTTRDECLGRSELLVHDRGTRVIINVVTLCLVSYMTGDVGYFEHNLDPGSHLVIIYGAVLFTEMLIWYSGLLMIILSMRAFLIRLSMVENEVNDAVDRYVVPTTVYASMSESEVPPAGGVSNEETGTAGSMSGLENSQALRWLEAYRSIRHDIHELSETFGPRMLAALFLMILEFTATITFSYEEMKDEFTGFFLFCLLASFGANATMISMVFFNMAFPVTRCSHHIGPKLSMIATKRSDNPQYQQLATTFLLAPVRVHVGNFEVSPEHANGVTAWFAALFLLVFGLTMPGLE